MTSILDLDPDVIVMYLCTKNEVSRARLSKEPEQDRETDGQTDTHNEKYYRGAFTDGNNIVQLVANDDVTTTTRRLMMCVYVFSYSFCLSCRFDCRNASTQKLTVRQSGVTRRCSSMQ